MVTISVGQRTAASDGTAPDNGRSRIAALDLCRAFSENAGLKLATEQLRADIAAAEQAFAARKQQLQQDSEKLQQLKQGSEEFRRDEEKLTEQAAAMREKANRLKRDLAQREAAMFLAAYREVESVLAGVAAEKGLRLVLQFRGEEDDGETAESVRAEMGKIVLYQRGIDVTDEVIERVARRAKGTP